MADPDTTADDISGDILRGAGAIAAYMGQSERQAYHQLDQGILPAFKVGKCWHMRKSTYRSFIAQLEAKAMSKAAA